MSSPCVIDSSKMTAQLDRFFRDAQKDKHQQAYQGAVAKQKAAVEGKDGNFLTADAEAQLGRPMMRQQIISRLTSINHNLIFRQSTSVPRLGGVYIRDGISNMDNPEYRGIRFVTPMEWTDISPEFTPMKHVEDRWGQKQPKIAKWGWRTILKRLIKERLITASDAERVFLTNRGRESQRWAEEIY